MLIIRFLVDLTPNQIKMSKTDDKLIVDGANGVGGEKLEVLKKMLNSMDIEVRNSGKGVLNEGVGADYVQKEKVVPQGFHLKDIGIRSAIFSYCPVVLFFLGSQTCRKSFYFTEVAVVTCMCIFFPVVVCLKWS